MIDGAAFAECIARRVAEILAELPRSVAPATFNRREAAEYCGLSLWTFDRERRRIPGDLAPIAETGPLARRWRKETLDVYLFAGGRLNDKRRGQPRKEATP